MSEQNSQTRWDRILKRWWLPIGLGVAGAITLPLFTGGYEYAAQVGVRFPDELLFPAEPVVTANAAPYARVSIGEARTDEMWHDIEQQIGASISRDFQIATSDEVLLTISADSPAAVLDGADAYVDALRLRWSKDVAGESARLAANIDVRVATLTERIDELDQRLAEVPGDTDVLSQILASDRIALSSQRESSVAALEELSRYAKFSPELVVVSRIPEPKAAGWAQSGALGLIGGGLLGLTLAVLWARLDRRVRSLRDAELACAPAAVIAGLGRAGVLSERDCAAAVAIAARPVLDGIAASVEIVQWETDNPLVAKLRDQLQLVGVTTMSPPPLSESAAAFVQAHGSSVILLVAPGRIEQRALANVVRRLRQAGAVQVGVLLGSVVGVEHERNSAQT